MRLWLYSNQKCCLKVLTANYKDVLNTLRIMTNSYILVIQSIFIIIKNCLINGFNVTRVYRFCCNTWILWPYMEWFINNALLYVYRLTLTFTLNTIIVFYTLQKIKYKVFWQFIDITLNTVLLHQLKYFFDITKSMKVFTSR